MLVGLLMCTEVSPKMLFYHLCSRQASSDPFQGGLYFVEFFNTYAATYGMLIAVFCESLVVAWIYGEYKQEIFKSISIQRAKLKLKQFRTGSIQ